MERVLFVHNSLPEYRIEFWNELNKKTNLTLLITDKEKEKQIYDFEKNTKQLDVIYFQDIDFSSFLKKSLCQYEKIILPPADDWNNFVIAYRLKEYCLKYGLDYYYWTEKWTPSISKQPIIKKIKNYVQNLMIKTLCDGAKKCIVSGTMSKKYLSSIGVCSNIISIAFDSSTSPEVDVCFDIRKKYGIDEGCRVVLFFGRLIKRKGCIELVNSWINNHRESSGEVLMFCGTGETENELKKIARSRRDVIFTGKIQPRQRRMFYEQSDVFVLPSLMQRGIIEAWGLTVNEALECGLPTIVTDVVGSGYDLINANNGIVISTDNLNSTLWKAILYVLNTEYDKKVIKKEYSKYTVSKMAESFFCAINE